MPLFDKKLAKKFVPNAMCPDKKMSCQDNMTCCETESGSYDCCPLPNVRLLLFNQFHSRRFCTQYTLEISKSFVWCLSSLQAVCCSNRNQCCPNGYTCDTKERTCIPGLTTVQWHEKIPAKLKSVKVGKECPGGKSSCSDNATCCPLPSGGYGCCPLPNVSIEYMTHFCGTLVHCKCEVTCDYWIYVMRSIALLEKYRK